MSSTQPNAFPNASPNASPNALPAASPRLERAAALRGLLGWSLAAFACGASVASWYLISPWPARSGAPIALNDVTLVVAGAFWLAVAALLCAWLVVRARSSVQCLRDEIARSAVLDDPAATLAQVEPALPSPDVRVRLFEEERDLARLGAWRQALGILFPLGIVAVLSVAHFPRLPLEKLRIDLPVALLVGAFPLLVIERRFGHLSSAELPEAPAIARLLRLCSWTLVGGGLASLSVSFGFEWAGWLFPVLAAVEGAIVAELALRALVQPFLGASTPEEAVALGDSLIAGLLFERLDPLQSFHAGLRTRFGVDLARSAAWNFVRKAALPLAVGLLACAWGLSSFTTLALGERGVYERLGVPENVLGPGLHVHLPWPLGAVRRVEFGSVHELALTSDAQARPGEEADPWIANQRKRLLEEMAAAGVEDQAPAGYDRVWEEDHPSEVTFLVAAPIEGASSGAKSFQLVNADLRMFWRVGLDDESARRAAYCVVDAPALMQAELARLVVHELAHSSLNGVLAADRERLASQLRTSLQQRLDTRESGIELVQVAIDAVHPPASAAAAYHRVQAAGIEAQSLVDNERVGSARLRADAQRKAIERGNDSTAVARESLSKARAAENRFAADLISFQKGGAALRLERRLETLGAGLSRAQLTIIDHRLELDGGPTIDLRRFIKPVGEEEEPK